MKVEQSSIFEAINAINDGFSAAYVLLRRGGASRKQARSFIRNMLEDIPEKPYAWEEEALNVGKEHRRENGKQPAGFGFSPS